MDRRRAAGALLALAACLTCANAGESPKSHFILSLQPRIIKSQNCILASLLGRYIISYIIILIEEGNKTRTQKSSHLMTVVRINLSS